MMTMQERRAQAPHPHMRFPRLRKFLASALIGSTLLFGSASCRQDPVIGVYGCILQDRCTTKFGIAPFEKVSISGSSIVFHKSRIHGQMEQGLTFQRDKRTGEFNGGLSFGRTYKAGSVLGAFTVEGEYLRIQSEDRTRGFGFEYKCRRAYATEEMEEEPAPEPEPVPVPEPQTAHRKGVFIRPCITQFYEYDGNDPMAYARDNTNNVLTYGGRTISEACADLRDSGVTDIFIGFRSDDYGKNCGEIGTVLYPNSSFNTRTGFDPVGTIIDTCRRIYRRAGKSIQIHAWVPIFHDSEGAKIAGQQGYIGGWGSWAWGAVFGRGEPGCTSTEFADPTNEDVIRRELGILDEITQRYGSRIHGISLDYIRYSDTGTVRCAGYDELQEVYEWDRDLSAPAGFVRRVVERYPRYIISGNIMPQTVYTVYRMTLGQEEVVGELEMIMPMLYSEFGASDYTVFEGEIRALRNDHPGIPIMADLRAWTLPGDSTEMLFDDLQRDIRLARGADGYALFTYESLLRETDSPSLLSIRDRIGF